MDVCANPDILRVIWFGLEIVDIVKIIIPISLIILGIINFSKSVISSDEKVQKKSVNVFFKRILYAILIFIIPWLIEVFIITLGNLAVLDSDEVNFTDCLDNANSECVDALENGEMINITKSCDVSAEVIKKLESNNCPGEIFLVNYYDNGVNKTETVPVCNDENFTFKTITNQETGCKNIRWDIKDSSNGLGFSVGVPYVFTDDFLDSVGNKGNFNLVPVWPASFTIDYYYEDGETLYKSVQACVGSNQKIENYFKDGYNTKWKLEYPIGNGITEFNISYSNNNYYTFSEEDIKGNKIKMTAMIEEITLDNCKGNKNKIIFFDETGENIVNTIEFCDYQLITFPSYNVSGRVFKGWDFKYNSKGMVVFEAGEKKSYSSAQLYGSITMPHQWFHLIPVFE